MKHFFTFKVIALISFFLFYPSNNVFTQTWTWINPLPQGNNINNVHVFDQNNALIVGKSCTIGRTTDGGNSWNFQYNILSKSTELKSVMFINSTIGWAVGDSGLIIKTTDGGNSWLIQNSNISNTLYSVRFVTIDTGWAVGGDLSVSTILKTTNGGVTWFTQTNSSNHLFSIFCFDSDTGWAVGKNGALIKTTNGGNNWFSQNTGTTNDILSINFINSTIGWLAGNSGTLKKTTNGGSSWYTPVTFGTGNDFSSVYFNSTNNGWVAGRVWDGSNYIGVSYRTTNAGISWIGQSFSEVGELRNIFVSSTGYGWIVGVYGAILKTSNSGYSWNYQSSGYKPRYLSASNFVDKYIGWAVGESGTLLKSTDAGVNWFTLATGTTEDIYTVFFIDRNIGWIATSNGKIFKTTNGGNNWNQQTSGTTTSIYSICFVDKDTGYVAGWAGLLRKSTNGGSTWFALSSPTTNTLNSISFHNSSKGWIAGLNIILKTTDNGQYWAKQTSSEWLTSICFVDENNGWASGDNGQILKTTNSGSSWQIKASGTNEWIESIDFSDINNGIAVGRRGVTLKTTDGGNTWTSLPSHTSNSIKSVNLTNASKGLAFGEGSNIFQYSGPISSPSILTIKNQLIHIDSLIQFYINSSGNPEPNFSLLSAPAGMTINPVSGMIQWIPDYSQTGKHTITVQAVNSEGSDVKSFDVIVYSPGTANTFDGNTDYVEVNHNSSLIPSNYITIEAWMKFTTGGSGSPRVIAKDASDNDGYQLYTNGTGSSRTVTLRVGNTSATSTYTLNSGIWYHLAGTYDGANVKLYIDGVSRATSSRTAAIPTNTAPLRIGMRGSNFNDDFYGSIDEVRIWNVARTQTEIQRDMNMLIPLGNGLIAQYHFNEGSGSTLNDYSGNLFNGAIYNATWTTSAALIYAEDPSGPMSARGYSTSSKSQQLTNGSYYNITSPYFEWSPATSGSGISGYSVALTTNNADTLATTVNVTDTSYTGSISTTGIYYLRIRSRNNNGDWNRARTVFTYKLDNTPPATFTLVSPTNGSYTDATPDLDWNSSSDGESGLARYRIYIDDFTNQFDSTTSSYYTVPTGRALAEGTHSWRIVAVDNAGNTRQSTQTYSFIVDATAPQSFNLLTPTNNSWTNNEPITLTWQASADAGSGIDDYRLYIDSVYYTTTTSTSINISGLADGIHNWYIKTYDNVGNNTRSNQTNIFNLDRLAPEGNSAMVFDGVNDYIGIPNSSSLASPWTSITMEAWIKISGYASNGWFAIITKNYQYGLTKNSNGNMVVRINGTDKTINDGVYSLNTWYHIAATWNGYDITLYRNGVQVGTSTYSSTINSTTDSLFIGKDPPGAIEYANGQIDEVRIWNTCRTSSQILNNYNKMISPQSGLVGYWRFNETPYNYSIALDNSGNNNNGSLRNGSYRTYNNVSTTTNFIINLINPQNNSFTNLQTPTFSWNKPIDQGIGLQKYQFYSDGSLKLDNINADDTVYTYSGSPTLTEGSHTFQLRAYDSLGNYGNSEIRTYTIDLTPPNAFNLTSPADGAYTTIQTPNFSWQATTDGSSGMRKYQLWIDGAIDVDSIPVGTTTTAPNNLLSEGAHTWFIRAYDKVGNYRNSPTRTIYGEYGPPTAFNLISPAEGDTALANKPLYKWNRSFDYGTGLTRYELWIDGAKDTNVSPTDTQIVCNKFYANGPHSWYVKAIDGANNSRSSNTINNFVIDNRPPQLINPISDVVYPEDSGTHLVVADLKTVFSDGGSLVFTRSVIGNGITAVISGDSLRVTAKPDSFGVYTVIIAATDDIAQTARDTFTVTITNVNDSPVVINPVTNRTINEDAGKVFVTRMNTVFRDADGDVLTYSAVSSNASKLSTIISNDSLYISTVKDSNGILNVFLSATDPSAAVARDTFQVTITAINDAPFISNSLRDTTFNEDFGRRFVRKLTTVFSDADNTILTYTASALSGGITPQISNDTLYLNSVLNFAGNVNVRVTASDGSLSVADTFMVTIINVNDAPYIANALRDTTFNEDFGRRFIRKMTTVFSDVDNPTLNYTASELNAGVTVDISNDSLYANSTLNFTGPVNIRVSASDGEFSVADTFLLTIIDVNDPPYVVTSIRDTSFMEDFGRTPVILLSDVFSDIDNPTLNYSAVNLSTGLSPSVSNDTLYLNSVLNFYGSVGIKVTASDGSLSVSDTFMVTVTNVNDAPYVANALHDTILNEDFGRRFVRKLTTVFADVDNTTLNYSSNPISAGVTVDISNDSLYANSTLNFTGLVNIRVSASDGEFTVADTFLLTVIDVNDPPYVVTAMRDTSFIEDFGRTPVILLSDVFSDIDNPTLNYSTVNLSSGLTPSVSNDTLYLNSELNFFGSVGVKVTASDGSLSVSDTFIVTITNINDPPQSFSLIEPQNHDTLPNWIDPVHFIWNRALDVDMDALTYIFRLFGSNLDTTIAGLTDTNFVFSSLSRLLPLTAYKWTSIVSDGIIQTASQDTFQFNTPFLVSIEDDYKTPKQFAVHQNFPNPFNPTTTIKFDLPKSSNVTLKIYNLLGQEVRTLVNGAKHAGYHSVIWDGKNNQGAAVSSGVYLYRLQAGEYSKTRKLMLLK